MAKLPQLEREILEQQLKSSNVDIRYKAEMELRGMKDKEPLASVADLLHVIQCSRIHPDECDWYEQSWQGWKLAGAKLQYMNRARRVAMNFEDLRIKQTKSVLIQTLQSVYRAGKE